MDAAEADIGLLVLSESGTRTWRSLESRWDLLPWRSADVPRGLMSRSSPRKRSEENRYFRRGKDIFYFVLFH